MQLQVHLHGTDLEEGQRQVLNTSKGRESAPPAPSSATVDDLVLDFCISVGSAPHIPSVCTQNFLLCSLEHNQGSASLSHTHLSWSLNFKDAANSSVHWQMCHTMRVPHCTILAMPLVFTIFFNGTNELLVVICKKLPEFERVISLNEFEWICCCY